MADPSHPDAFSQFRTTPVRTVVLDATTDRPRSVSPSDIHAVSRADAPVRLSDAARLQLTCSRDALEAVLTDGRPHYGINTGFGSFSRQRISASDLEDLQHNLIRSHCTGVGSPLPRDVVRATMFLLAASLSRGCSGVRPIVVETLLACLNAGVTPIVPETGSVGASGDLAPLAHIALMLTGEGNATTGAQVLESAARPASGLLRDAGIAPLRLCAKEGLALINGTHLMAARATLNLVDASTVFNAALLAAAMSIDACRATDSFLDPRIYVVRNHTSAGIVAAALRRALAGSEILPSHRIDDPRVQDPYSLRCVAPVIGAALDALQFVARAALSELGAVTDNPLLFAKHADADAWPAPDSAAADLVSAGNFHGMPIALPLDVLSIALCHLAGISERRVYHMLSAFDPDAGLPPFLSPKPGLHSGLMIAQYTAAACCNELAGLANPASTINISTSAGMEDYNSFGPRSAAKAARAVQLVRSVVAIEFLCAAQAIDHHRPLRTGLVNEQTHQIIRARIPIITADRPFWADIRAIEELIATGSLPSLTV